RFLGGARVVRGDDQAGVRARITGDTGQLQRLVHSGRSGAWHERNRVIDLGGGGADRFRTLVERLCAGFAGRAADGDAVRAVGQLPTDQVPQAGGVQRTVVGERGDHGAERAGDLSGIITEFHVSASS